MKRCWSLVVLALLSGTATAADLDASGNNRLDAFEHVNGSAMVGRMIDSQTGTHSRIEPRDEIRCRDTPDL